MSIISLMLQKIVTIKFLDSCQRILSFQNVGKYSKMVHLILIIYDAPLFFVRIALKRGIQNDENLEMSENLQGTT